MNNTLTKVSGLNAITIDSIKADIAKRGNNVNAIVSLNEDIEYSKSMLQFKMCGTLRALQDINYLKTFGDYSDLKDFLDKNPKIEIAYSTASEMCKVFRVFKEKNKNEYVIAFITECDPTYTELVELFKVSNQKGKSADDNEILNDVQRFLEEYAPKNSRSWNTMSELRNIIKIYKGAVTVNKNDNKETPKPTVDKNAVISVEDISAKNAATIVKSLKENGDVIENKAKKTCVVEADNLEEFMNRVVALAKAHKVKPMELIGKITMTINWSATEGKEGE